MSGYQGPLGVGGAPSGSKPESKLWFNDGRWWASMWDTSTSDFYIYQLNSATETWSRTGTRLDDRSSTRADVLWDGSKLYVASHNFSESDGSGTARLYRYSYNSGSKTYSLDSGFPATINSVKSETLVLAKDSTGQLWATWEAGGTIWVNRTTSSDTSWGTPFALPGAASVDVDDISSIIAFGGNKVGILWSDQSSPNADYFAVHRDVDGDTTWSIETAYAGTGYADDHINLKTDASGTVYAAVKTSLTGSNPLLVLLVRTPSGNWSNHTISIGSTDHTRPILQIDEANALLRVYYASGGSGGTINEKTSPMGAISFPSGSGTVVIKDAECPEDEQPVQHEAEQQRELRTRRPRLQRHDAVLLARAHRRWRGARQHAAERGGHERLDRGRHVRPGDPVGDRRGDVRPDVLDRDRAEPRHTRLDHECGLRRGHPQQRLGDRHVYADQRLHGPGLVHLPGQ